MTATSTFMEALYGRKPDGSLIVISTRNGRGWGPTSFADHITEAAGLVAGAVDVYTRISVIGEIPPRGRGTAALSIAIPGLWVEVDVNGAPDGRGGTITDAFDSLEQGLDIAAMVAPLSLGVASGYGGHGYVLFPEPWILQTDEDRAAAKALVQRYQSAVRGRAQAELGIAKLDSTHDLARVFRPPGSFNGKGEQPVPVELRFLGERRTPVDVLDCGLPPLAANGRRTREEQAGATQGHGRPGRRRRRARRAPGPGDALRPQRRRPVRRRLRALLRRRARRPRAAS